MNIELNQKQQLNKNAVISSVLTLKEIAPYLPYELKLKFVSKYDVDKLSINDNVLLKTIDEGYISVNGYKTNNKSYLPILRPLSDLKNEIEVNGEKFIPAVYLSLVGNYKNIWGFEFDAIHYWEISSCVKEVEKLYEWHFDVFNLIERGLAVSIHDVV